MKIKDILKKYPEDEVIDIITNVLGKPKEFLYLNIDYALRIGELTNFKAKYKRLQKGEPLAYILGYKYFYGLKFKVNKNVLVPRPETEWLVERALKRIKNKELRIKNQTAIRYSLFPVRILDLATGSGCVAISIANTYKVSGIRYKVAASDISTTALNIAKSNAKSHDVNVTFIQSDLFENIQGKFDIITANLPYIPLTTYNLLLTTNIHFEPKSALTDNTDTYEIYAKFFKALPKHLKPSGMALLEIDEESKSALSKMLKKTLPKFKAKFYKDIRGMWRYLEITF